MELTGAQILLECLHREGVTTLFGYPGGAVIDIYDAEVVKSITVRFSFGLDDRTLTGEEVQKSIDDILEKLATIGVKMKS